jgi:Ca2+-binding RTX toxin-like protein
MANGTVEGTSGDDFLIPGFVDADGDTIDGSSGTFDDIIDAGAGNDTVDAGEGNDTLYGGEGDDKLVGASGDDVLDGGVGANRLFGEAGDDVFVGGDGADTFFGGDGQDTIDYSGSAGAVNVDLTAGTLAGGDADNDVLGDSSAPGSIEAVVGSEFDDVLVGSDQAAAAPGNRLYGGGGNDSIDARDGDDIVDGGAGNDILSGGLGADQISGGDDRDLIYGDAGDAIDGGAGGDDYDTLDLRGQGAVNIINTVPDSNGNGFNGTVEFLDGSGAVTGTLDFTEIENILTDDGNHAPVANDDTATAATGGSVVIDVLANDTDPDGDTLSLLGTPTALHGTVAVNGDGTITYTPDAGYSGTDTVTYEISDGNGGTDVGQVEVDVQVGTALDGIVSGTGESDLIDLNYTGDPQGDMIDHSDAILPGEAPNDDIVEAGAGADTVYGGEGNDEIHGGSGSDILHGGTGDDFLDGGTGPDTIYGGEGSDSVIGGSGNDLIDTSGPEGAGSGAPDQGYPGVFTGDTDPLNDRDVVDAGAGDDTIITGDDDDSILGGAGNDTIDAGFDDDTIHGGGGDDFIVGGEGADEIDGGAGNDTIYGGLDPSFPDSFNIPDTADLLPDNGTDTIHGGSGDDTIFGEDDADMLFGDEGDDVIDGGIDDDTIVGGQGADAMTGGDDRDTFLIGSAGEGAGDSVDGGSGGIDYDVLDLTGAGPFRIVGETLDADGNSTSGTIEFLDAPGGNVTGTMTFGEIEEIIPCFTPGTMIATPKGERPVEDLEIGDKVITRDHGTQVIRWVGKRDMSALKLSANPHLQPVLIPQGALGKDLPERDMLVSPNHRVMINTPEVDLHFNQAEVLVPAKHLVESGIAIQTVCATGTSYIHFMFDNHEVVLSNGAWTESFQPGDLALNGVDDAARAEIFELFPELEQQEGREAYGAARLSLKKHEARLLFK